MIKSVQIWVATEELDLVHKGEFPKEWKTYPPQYYFSRPVPGEEMVAITVDYDYYVQLIESELYSEDLKNKGTLPF